jgi:hypothetical protein
MTIYVDNLGLKATVFNKVTGKNVTGIWYHMFSDQIDPEELHLFAQRLGLRRSYFQRGTEGSRRAPWKDHYDIVASKKHLAFQKGATIVDNERAVEIWREKRDRYLSSLASGG